VSVGEPTLEGGLYLSPFRFRKFWRCRSLGLREFTKGWRENPADLTDFRTGGLSRGKGLKILPRFWNFCDRMVMNDIAGMGRA